MNRFHFSPRKHSSDRTTTVSRGIDSTLWSYPPVFRNIADHVTSLSVGLVLRCVRLVGRFLNVAGQVTTRLITIHVRTRLKEKDILLKRNRGEDNEDLHV